MTDFYRNAQVDPAAGALTDLISTGAGGQTVISSIMVCNRNAFDVKFRISLAQAGAADAAKQYLYYDVALAANDTFVATLGLLLFTSDVIRCYSDRGGVSFNVFGMEQV